MCYVTGWYRGKKRTMKFAILRIWPQPTDHSSNCYFCMVDPTKRRTGKNVPQIVYPDIPSSITPVPHCPELPRCPVSTGILPHSLPEWAFRARPGLWRICLCPKVARIAEQKFGSRYGKV